MIPTTPSVLFDGRRLRLGWRLILFLGLVALLSGVSAFPVVALCLASWAMARWVDRRPFASLGLAVERATWVQLLWGAALGAVLAAAVVGAIAGTIIVRGGEVAATGQGSAGGWLLPALAHFGIAFFEELLARGYALQTLIESVGTGPALAATALGFALLHWGNPGLDALALLNLGLAGLLLGVLAVRTRSLWLPIGFHWGWNLTLGHVLGLPVSGVQLPDSLFNVAWTAPAWLGGGAFGPEASVAGSLALAATATWAWRTPRLRAAPAAATLWRAHVPERAFRARGANDMLDAGPPDDAEGATRTL